MLMMAKMTGLLVGGEENKPPMIVDASGTVSSYDASVPLPTGYASGDVLLIFLLGINGSFTTPSGWTQERDTTSDVLRGALYSKIATGSEGSAVSISTTANFVAMSVAVRNVTVINDGVVTFSESSTATGAGVTAAAEGILVGMYLAIGESPTFTTPTGMTEVFNFGGIGEGYGGKVVYQENVPAGATGNKTATASGSAANAGVLIHLS